MDQVKKPARTLWRVVGGIVALVFCGIAWIVFSSSTARPVISVDYGEKIEAMSRSYQTGVETQANRYGEYAAIMERVERLYEEIEGERGAYLGHLVEGVPVDALVDPAGPLGRHGIEVSSEDADSMRAFLRALDERGIIDEMRALADARHAVCELAEDALIYEAIVGSFGNSFTRSFYLLVGSFRALAVEAMESGDSARAVELIEAACVCVRLYSSRAFLVSGLLVNGSEGVLLLTVRALVADGGFDEAQLAAIARILDEQRPLAFDYALRSERMALLDAVQRCYTNGRNGDGYLIASHALGADDDLGVGEGVPEIRVLDFVHGEAATRREVETRIDRFFDESYAVLADFEREIDALAEIASGDGGSGGARVELDDDRVRVDMILEDLLAAYVSAARAGRRGQVVRAATGAVVGLERHRLSEDVYPGSLDEVGAWPGLVYRLEDGGSSYTLYAVGEDGVDDGGDAELDWVYVPVGSQ